MAILDLNLQKSFFQALLEYIKKYILVATHLECVAKLLFTKTISVAFSRDFLC